ncbi:MAG: PAS domain S-box protein [Burkholderiales bacterium]
MEQEDISEADSSRKSLASAFAAVPWGVALTAPDGRFLEANAAYCRIVGHTVAELRQTDSLAITHVDDRTASREHMASAMARNAQAVFWEKRYVRKDGEFVGVRGSLSAIRGADRKPLHLIGIFEDVTERNATADALLRASALVEIAGRVALVGGWTIDLIERKLIWSDVVSAIHDEPAGYSPSLAAGLEYFVPEHRGIVREAVERCLLDGTPYDLELEKITASGRRIWVRTIGQAERDEHGAILRIQGAFQDISSRKQNERAALEVSERLRVTLESITDAFCTVDREWRFTYVNRDAQSLLAESNQPLVDRNLWTELPQLLGTAFEDQIRNAISGEMPMQFEHLSQRLSRWFSVTVFPSSQGLAIYFRDISEARAVRKRLELLEVSVAHLHDVVVIIEAAPLGDPGPRIQYVNEAFTRITGFERDDVIGRSPRLLQGALTDRAELKRIRAALDRSEPVHSELLNYTKMGLPYWIEMDIVPVAFAGEVCSHFIAVERDVTERKRAQQVLIDEDIRLRFLHDLAEAVRSIAEPEQVMAETARRLGDHLHASRAVYSEVEESAERSVGTNQIIGAVGATLICPLRRQGILRGTMTLRQGDSRDWTSSEIALIEQVVARSWDVAERLTAESELRENVSLLRMAGHTAKLGGWAVDLPMMEVHWSDEACDILDAPPGAKPALEEAFNLYSATSRDSVTHAFERCARQGIPFDLDLELRTLKGRVLFVRCTGQAQMNANGGAKRVHGALQDITERHEAEIALRSSRDEFRTLTEAMPQIVWMTGPDGSNIYSNQQWIDYTGLTLEESRGGGWSRAIHPDDQQRVLGDWQQAQAALGVLETQTRLRRADGVYRWWLMRGVAQLDAAGHCIKWVGTCTDIHTLELAKLDLVASKEALQKSERRFTDLLQTVHLLSVMLDLEGRITYCNDYLLGLTGWQRDEVIGRNWFALFLQADPVTATERFTKILARSVQSWERENEIVTRTGERRTIRWSSSMLRSADGKVIGSASIGEDITEGKRDQLALVELNAELESRVQARTAQLSQAREDADQANKAKSSFLAAMSHEIRTPMNGVIGMIDVLQQTNLNGPQVEMVDLVHESAISLLSIIDDILDFSKIEAGKLSIASEPIDPGVVVERACALLAPMANKRGVRLSLFIDPSIPAAALGDEGRFRQVVINLVGNAIKFCSGGSEKGRVSVRALRVADRVTDASSDRADDFTVDLVIADNGVGMDEVTQSRLFTPFAQADASTTRRFGGTGLGLAICDMLVSLMHGHISVRSSPGQGSTFTVRLPFRTTATAPAPSVSALGMLVGEMRCCIVGSEQPLADDLACTLRSSGLNVVTMPELAAAAAATPVAGLSLWLVLPDQAGTSAEALRAMAPSTAAVQTRFVVLGRGGRRSPRMESNDVISIDADALGRSTLSDALLLAAQSAQPTFLGERDRQPASTIAPKLTLHPVQSRSLPVLVAEDNETNRAVIVHQLRLLGLVAEVCTDGREALDRWRGGDYALLLTDLHMPVMDGYELAAAIRSEESPERRLPIIALTANGLAAEELRCLAAGMDAYLTKPVRLPQLRAAIAAWLAPPAAIPSPRPPTVASIEAPVDLTILAGFMGDDPAVTEEVLVAFRHSTERSVVEFDLALNNGAIHVVADAAHKLKSAARSIGAERLGQLCAELEDAAQTRSVDDVRVLAPQFRAECRAVLDFLASR